MTAMVQAQRWCKSCGRNTLHARPTFSDTAGCFLTLLTLGLFLPFWLFAKMMRVGDGPWRCQVCGSKRWT